MSPRPGFGSGPAGTSRGLHAHVQAPRCIPRDQLAGWAATADLALGSKTTAGAKAGTLSAKGPVNTAETTVSLAKEVTAPSIWWRLTHPLELFGIDKQ